MNKKTLAIFLLLAFIITAGPICKGTSQEVLEAMKPINLTYWRVFDDQDAFDEIITAYKAVHPNVSVTYRKLRMEEYEQTLLDALAEDRGPDMFSLPNTWVREYQTKILPMPKTITLPYQVTTGTIKKETTIQLQTTPTLSLRALKTDFMDQVAKDVVLKYQATPEVAAEERIFGLPLYLDTLALFYNRDILNSAGIPEPPKTWAEFQEDVKKIAKIDKQGNILQAGAAFGTATNVERAPDILSLLMMQNGTVMADEDGNATFAAMPAGATLTNPPGEDALGFYTDFASPYKEVYTWNGNMPNSLEAFSTGRAAFFFGYSYHIPQIRNLSPKLNFAISKMPQIEGNQEINFTNYWVETVSTKTKNQNEAWDFLQFAAKAENAQKYLTKTKKPTAIRSLVASQIEDLDLAVFASELLTAKSWYQGMDAPAMEKIMSEMIENVVSGTQTIKEAIGLAQGRVNQTIRQ
ncbi:MAG: extracellular solute-binding protein [Candidatus Buchananbacteria bacterium]|jgi:multiple sugar transport system substrate-binding protein